MSGRHGRIEGARLHFRLPPDLKRWLEDRAAGRVRTMTSELVDILEKTRNAEKGPRNMRTLAGKQTGVANASPTLCHEGSAA
ncbi:MAG: hypothetical protein ABF504_10115 [Komagataeibacter saccharivorans]